MLTSYFKVGTFCFSIQSEEPLPIPETLRHFTISGEGAYTCYPYRLGFCKKIDVPQETPLAQRYNFRVYPEDDGEFRLLGFPDLESPYALCCEASSHTEIRFAEDRRALLVHESIFCSLLSLERHMLRRGALILHCAYTRFHGVALLFSAPSGTGKSTQAGLWEKYRSGETVNGDRALLRKAGNRWLACGWPICGSSGICLAEDTPIGAIVMLSQAGENRVHTLDTGEAFRRLLPQIMLNRWDPAFVSRAADLLEDLCRQVPVLHLECTISEEAVSVLEARLPADFQLH